MTEIIIRGDWSEDQLREIKNTLCLLDADTDVTDDFLRQAAEQIGFAIDAKKPGGM